MANMVDSAAEAIAAALAPQPPSQYARWRWGTVLAVHSDGTMDVTVGGATMPSVRCATSACGARVGDRVRVAYQGTDAIVDAVRSSALAMPLESTVSYASGGTATITLPSNVRYLLVSAHNSTANLNGIALVTGSTVFKLAGAGGITFSRSGLTITATSSGNPAYYLIPLE